MAPNKPPRSIPDHLVGETLHNSPSTSTPPHPAGSSPTSSTSTHLDQSLQESPLEHPLESPLEHPHPSGTPSDKHPHTHPIPSRDVSSVLAAPSEYYHDLSQNVPSHPDSHTPSSSSSNPLGDTHSYDSFELQSLDKMNASESELSLESVPKPTISQRLRQFWDGPLVPRDDPPAPFHYLSSIEEIPAKFKQRVPKSIRVSLLVCYLLLWFGLCYSIVVPYFTVPPNDGTIQAVQLSCMGQLDWRGKNGACGLHGSLCSPPDNDVIIRCPALCDRNSWAYSLVPIGDQRIKYRSFVVGGGETEQNGQTSNHDDYLTKPYRADSYTCGAGVHSGAISPFFGGCARVSFTGEKQGFPGVMGHYGIESISFLSFFQSSFAFKPLASSFSQCYDPRLLILIMNIVLGIPIVFLASGAVVFWTINIVGFWTIVLATDPPKVVSASNPEDFAALISIGLERFLPSCFILYVMWRCSSKRALSEPPAALEVVRSPLSRVIFWYPTFWLGVLNNVTFDRLPVDRLTVSDIKEQPGALLSIAGIVSLIAVCAFVQAYKIWLSGRFKKYLVVYVSMLSGLFLVAHIPGLTLRVHHYILAIILLPGCSTRGITALLFQGILLGLFLSGAARWGLAAIAETVITLAREDPIGRIMPPQILGFNATTGIFSWKYAVENITPQQEKLYKKFSSVSILVNDVEQYVGDKIDSINLKELFKTRYLSSLIKNALNGEFRDENGDVSIFLRLGRKMKKGDDYSDFTNSAVLKWPSGKFHIPEPGLT